VKKLIAALVLVAASFAAQGTAQATLSNCTVGTYWRSGVPTGAYSACYGPSGVQRIVVTCSDGSHKVGAWVGSGQISKSISSGHCSGFMTEKHVAFR
jgi:hypothetical protein